MFAYRIGCWPTRPPLKPYGLNPPPAPPPGCWAPPVVRLKLSKGRPSVNGEGVSAPILSDESKNIADDKFDKILTYIWIDAHDIWWHHEFHVKAIISPSIVGHHLAFEILLLLELLLLQIVTCCSTWRCTSSLFGSKRWWATSSIILEIKPLHSCEVIFKQVIVSNVSCLLILTGLRLSSWNSST